MLGLFVINYFIMGLTRYAHDLPFGMILDALIFYNILIISLQGHDAPHRMEARQLRADRRRGDLGGVLRARSGEPRIGFGFGMVLVREVRGVLLLLHRGAHPAHDEPNTST